MGDIGFELRSGKYNAPESERRMLILVQYVVLTAASFVIEKII